MKKLFSVCALFLAVTCLNGTVLGADILKQGKDTQSGLGYTVIQDAQNLTIAFDFSGPIRLMQMARNGFTLYINEKGKKKEDMGFVVTGVHPPRRQGAQPEMVSKRKFSADADSMPQRPRKEAICFRQAQWKNGDELMQVDLSLDDSGFKTYLQQDESLNRCVVVIPIEMINPNGLAKPEKMMIGLISEVTQNKEKSDDQSAVRPRTSQEGPDLEREGDRPMGEGPMGGEPGGMRGSRMGGPGGMRQGAEMRPDRSAFGPQVYSSNTIKLWFKCK